MKYSLCIVLVWVSVITHTTAVLANETRDENASNLVLSLDCEGQLFFPFLEAHFNFSERVLSIFWDLKHHMIDFSPCNYTDSACNTTRVYKRGDETIYTVQMHFESCPKKIRPAILITCVGEKCSKLYRPCESDSDCLPTLTCGTSLGADLDSYGDQLISEILSQILYPQHRPTTRWSLCDVSYYTTVVQLNEQVSGGITNVAENREQQLRHSAFIVNSPGNASLLQATCNGRIDLFGRRHFVGVIPRAILTLSMLPTGILKRALDTNTIVKLMKWFGVAYIPLGRYYIYLAEKYTESDISLVDKDVGKWLVRHRLFGETITIEINPCATKDDNVFLDVKATEGIQSLLSYKSCSRHTECASAVCLPSRRIAWSQQKTTPLLLKRLLEIEGLNNICFPKLQNTVTTPFDNDTFSSELVSIFDTHIFPQPYTQKKNQPAQQVANQCTQADQSSGSSFWTWILAIFFFVLLIGGCSKKDPEQQQ